MTPLVAWLESQPLLPAEQAKFSRPNALDAKPAPPAVKPGCLAKRIFELPGA